MYCEHERAILTVFRGLELSGGQISGPGRLLERSGQNFRDPGGLLGHPDKMGPTLSGHGPVTSKLASRVINRGPSLGRTPNLAPQSKPKVAPERQY